MASRERIQIARGRFLIVEWRVEPYAKPAERKTGANRLQIAHLPRAIDTRTRSQRAADKQTVAAQRRAIKKSARYHLKQQLLEELDARI